MNPPMALQQCSVGRYMSTPLVTFHPEMPIDRALAVLQRKDISAAPVVADGTGLGIVSRTDLLRLGRSETHLDSRANLLGLPHLSVSAAMTPVLTTVGEQASIVEAARLMTEHHVHRVFVRAGAKLTGVISTKEILRAMIDERAEEPIESFMSEPVLTVEAELPLSEATDRLRAAGVAGLVVTDRQGCVIGVFTQREALDARHRPGSTHVERVMTPSLLFLDRKTPAFQAAAQAVLMRPRRVLATENGRVVGIATGLDFARAAA